MCYAAVDNDFICHLAEIEWKNKDTNLSDIVEMLFQDMNVKPIMHEFVYKYELDDDGNIDRIRRQAKEFFDREIVSIKRNDDYLITKEQKIYYEYVFKEIYREFIGEVPIRDIWNGWIKKASLGETHTVVMCSFVGCGIFLSDDKGSILLKQIIKDKFNFEICIYDRDKAVEMAKQSGHSKMNKGIRRALTHKIK